MKAAVPLLLLGMLLTGPAHAAVDVESCKADAQKYCPGVKPGGGAIEACLKKNETSLSPECMQFRKEMKGKVDTFAKACGGDIKTYCAKVQPGEGRILKCLKQNETTLSPTCKGQMTPASR